MKTIRKRLHLDVPETRDIREALFCGRRTWWLLLIVQLVLVPFSVSDIILIRIVTDKVIVAGRVDLLLPIGATFCGILLVMVSLETWVQYRAIRLGQFWDSTIKDRFLRSILHKPLEFFHRMPTGEILYRVLNDSATLPNYMTQMRWSLAINACVMVVIVGLMFYLDVPLALLVLACLPFQAWGLRDVGHRCRRSYELLKLYDQDLLAHLDNITTHAESLKAFSLENRARRDWFSNYRVRLRGERRLLVLQKILVPLLLRVNSIMAIVIICYGGYRVATGTLSLGTFMAFLLVATRFLGPIQFLAGYHVGLQDIVMCCRRVRAAWQAFEHNIRPDTPLFSKPVPVHHLSSLRQPGRLRVAGVGYTYGDGKAVLQNVDWEIARGHIYRLCGQNGSGKSTLLKVAAGLLTPQRGQILLDDTAISDIRANLVRRHVMYVSRENYWFKGTLHDNICYGLADGNGVSQGRLEELAGITGIDRLFENSARGLDGHVATGGDNFSAGEKQRLALLRVLLSRPAYVFLDESLTSIHHEDAAQILLQMRHCLGSGTALVYVHHGVDFHLPGQQDVELHMGTLSTSYSQEIPRLKGIDPPSGAGGEKG